jgi:hypothetical protein
MAVRKTSSRKKKSESKDIGSMIEELYLPEGEVIEPPENFLAYCFLIYGESGIGKTSTMACFPNSYVIQLDPNRTALAIRQTNVPDIPLTDLKRQKPEFTPWEMIVGLVEKAVEDDSVECVFIDNFGLMYEHALRHICYKKGLKDPTEADDWGQTWREIKDSMTDVLNKLLYANKGIGLIAHDTEKEIELPGGKISRIEPSLMKGAFDWVKGATNYAFYMRKNSEGDREFLIRSDIFTWTKCCIDENNPHFNYDDGSPMSAVPCGSSPREGYENLMKAFDNEFQKPVKKSLRKKKTTRKKTRKTSK